MTGVHADFEKRDTATGRFFATEPVGSRIRQRREERGLLAIELAKRAGVSKSYLSELEAGLKTMRMRS